MASSVLAYPVARTIITTLTDGHFVAHMGWYMDDRRSGPVWHRWPRHWLSSFGISVIAAIYGLWCRGHLDVMLGTTSRPGGLWLVSLATVDPLLEVPLIESAIKKVVDESFQVPIGDVVDKLPWPNPHRTLGDYLLGTDSSRAPAEKTWFPCSAGEGLGSPETLVKGLDVAKAFVQLEACVDIYAESLPDETEAERRDLAQLEIEEAVLSEVSTRL